MSRSDPLINLLFSGIVELFSFISTSSKKQSAKSVAYHLQKIVISSPNDVESKKNDIAIKMNVDAELFEMAWEIVALKNPNLFPKATRLNEERIFNDAINQLYNSPKRIIKKTDVAQISGLSHDKVELMWPKLRDGYFGSLLGAYIENDPHK